MLQRVLEPELMDTADEALDYDTMDHSAVNRVFVDDLLAVWDGMGTMVDLGAGTAQIPIVLCQSCPTAKVVAVDAAAHMLRVAAANVQRAGLEQRIRLEHVDAKGMPFADASFDALMSNSIVHHIPEPRNVFGEMVRVVRPGGVLFVRDLHRPRDEAEVRHLVQAYTGSANEHQQAMFEASLRAALTLDEVRALVVELGFDRAGVQLTSDRHWTWVARR